MKINDDKYFPVSEAFDYQKFPFYWIARVEALYKQQMEKPLKTIGMNASRWRVGLLLRVHKELTITDIANKALGKIPTITKIVQNMEKEGLVAVHKQKDDGRVRIVTLTPQGKAQVDQIVETTATLFDHVFSDFTVEEIETLVSLNRRLFDNLEKL